MREFGKELVEYAFISSGFKRNIFSFFQYIPITYLKDIGYGDFIEGMLGELNTAATDTILVDLLDDFFKSNWNDVDIVPAVPRGYTSAHVKNKTKKVVSVLKVTKRTDTIYLGNNTMTGEPMYKPYIKIVDGKQVNLYQFAGLVYEDKKSKPVYTIQPKLGYYEKGVTFKEYGLERSVFASNNENITPELLTYLEIEANIAELGNRGSYESFTQIDKYSLIDYLDSEEVQETDLNIPTVSELPEDVSEIAPTFKGYKGGFENVGKGTIQGDGKDKAMRKVADGFIGEIVKTKSSSQTSANEISEKVNKRVISDFGENVRQVNIPEQGKSGGSIIMLARNGTLSGKNLEEETKRAIRVANIEGSSFVVGDMPNVDSQFIDYLQEIGAEFTIYHTGNTPRINIEQQLIVSLENNTEEKKKETEKKYKHCK